MSGSWPSAAVAIALVVALAAMVVASIIKYPVEEVLKVWSALGSLVGVVTGAVATYFFQRENVEATRRSEQRAWKTFRALREAIGPTAWEDAKKNPTYGGTLQSVP